MSDATPTPAAPAAPEPLGTLGADRPCARCGFNLYAQTVAREPHYNLPIARCPECGTVAALQEYPALGPWARRWGFALAALWVVLLVLAFAITVGVAAGRTMSAAITAAMHVAEVLVDEHDAWAAQHLATPRQSPYSGTAYTRWDQPDPSWPALGDPASVLQRRGGVWRSIDRTVPWLWIQTLIGTMPLGLFWGVALPHQRPWRAALVPAAAVGLGAVLLLLPLRIGAQSVLDFESLAVRLVAPMVVPASLGVVLAGLVGWTLAARPIARTIIRMALPPAMRVPFAFLWRADAKPMPPGNRPGQGRCRAATAEGCV